MRLSGIKIAGFKSFVDPTHLPLPANLTGVVGPNGCGKSNVIDAVRWVLGETSIKNLRAADAEDVIFNGSKTRKPVGRASVELTFDNSDGQVAGPYAAYSEIAVRRELTRDGNSQYYLNGRKCLKRDVTDLFLGTGLGGKNQYAIIEQGMVSRMIEAKPEELRQWLEEAAGISKYKDRRKETESRIKQTRENLARLNDLRTEIAQRLEVLQKQAANAEKYKEFKTQERQLRAEILALRQRALVAQSGSHESAIAELEKALEEARAAVKLGEDARVAAEIEQRVAGQALNDEQSKVYEAEAALARQEQSLTHARELKSLKARELDELARRIADVERRTQAEQKRLQELTQALAALDQNAATSAQRESDAQGGLIEAEENALKEQNRWEEFTQRAETPLFQTEGERVRVQQMERAQLQIEERHKRLSAEQQSLNIGPIQASLFDVDAELTNLNNELSEAQTRLQALDGDLQLLRDERSAAEKALHETRQSLQTARGRMASLETLQQAALRQDDAELNAWLRQHQLQDLPRLASALQVAPGWESAVEHALDGLLQAPLLPQLSERLRAIANAPKAGAVLIGQTAGNAGAAGTLAAHTTGPAAVIEFLSAIHAVASSEEAQARAATLAPGESVMTADGIWRGRDWVRYPRRDADRSGVIARGQLLKQLKAQIDEQQQAVLDKEKNLGDLRNRIQALEAERRDKSGRFDQARARQAQRMAFRQAQAVRLEQTEARMNALTKEIDGLAAQREQHTRELAETRERLVSLEAHAAQLRDERTQIQQAMARTRDAVQRARMALNQATQARNELNVQLAGKRSALSALEQTLRDLAAQAETLAAQKAEQEKLAAELDLPLQNQSQTVDQARAAVQAARDVLRGARERLDGTEKVLAAAVAAARNAEFAKDAAVEKVQAARIEFENLRARREGLSAQIEETGLDRDALFAGLAEDATAEAWEEKLAAVLRRIDRLGAINLAAIQELEEAQAREKYLGDQHADLHGALETLEEAIKKIDTETQSRFKETFDKVNDVFKDRFPKLFGGGEAYLELTGEDLLDTGVRVMARPPGKRNSTIHLLSGGEKAMTAVALLLALFQLNPAPFCLMDEVDAPLDDANVGRFCEIVREMSHNVQFIIITHNKITMELAAHLHGVTMQEPGVSRLVSVDVQQAVELAGKPEAKE
ncbi:MAG: chromosome segregation protein SMC [Nevskiaceae bacterium]|nr:MAG: chromosome segregation protein SMC [Nevskiaceae bacterium]